MLTTRRHWPTGRKSRGFAAGAAWNLAGVAAQVASVADLLVWKARKSPLREVGKSVQTRGPGWGRTTRILVATRRLVRPTYDRCVPRVRHPATVALGDSGAGTRSANPIVSTCGSIPASASSAIKATMASAHSRASPSRCRPRLSRSRASASASSNSPSPFDKFEITGHSSAPPTVARAGFAGPKPPQRGCSTPVAPNGNWDSVESEPGSAGTRARVEGSVTQPGKCAAADEDRCVRVPVHMITRVRAVSKTHDQ